MSSFDAAKATADYLSILSPEAHAKATAYTQGGHWLLLWGTVIAIAISWMVLKSGILVRIRNGLAGKPVRGVLAILAVSALVEGVLSLPWNIYSDWWRETAYGLTSQSFAGWFGEWALITVINSVIILPLLGGLYFLIRKAPKTWWLWGGVTVSAFFMALMVLAPVFLEPIFNEYTPAPPGPVREAVVAMAKANGVPSDKIFIYDGSKQSNRYTANVSGLGSTARVAMSDVMFKKDADLAEVRAVVGHEMGHYKHNDVMGFAAVFGILGLVAFFLIDKLFPTVAALLGARDVQGIGDAAGFPIISIILAVLALLATPITSSITRIAETNADQFSLERVNEPDGLARALAKTIEYRAATPSKLEEVLFYDHPAVGNRIRMAMDWKAAHPAPVPAAPVAAPAAPAAAPAP